METKKFRFVLYDGGGEGAGAGGGDGGDAGGAGAAAGGTVALPDGAVYSDARFREGLPDDLKSHPQLASVQGVEHMARSYLSAQKMVGKDPNRLVEIPGADDAAGRRSVLDRLGVPKEAKDYKLEPVKGGPEFMAPTGPLAEGFRTEAHKLGLLPEQVAGVYSWFSGVMGATSTQQAESQAMKAGENIQALEAKHGAAFQGKVAAAGFAVDKLGGPELKKVIDDAGLGTHPLVFEAFAQVGALLAEDGIGDGRGGGGGSPFNSGMSPDAARAKGKELAGKALDEKNLTEKRKLSEEAQRYFKMATGGK